MLKVLMIHIQTFTKFIPEPAFQKSLQESREEAQRRAIQSRAEMTGLLHLWVNSVKGLWKTYFWQLCEVRGQMNMGIERSLLCKTINMKILSVIIADLQVWSYPLGWCIVTVFYLLQLEFKRQVTDSSNNPYPDEYREGAVRPTYCSATDPGPSVSTVSTEAWDTDAQIC